MYSITVIKGFSYLPMIVDPSHAASRYSLVPTITKAAVTKVK